jgi:RHS repeat-associated protein
VTDPFGLGGSRVDPSGLYHMGARYMDPIVAQFAQPDPSGEPDPQKPQSLNRYSYAGNNPVRLIDPSGYAGMSAGAGSVTLSTPPAGSTSVGYYSGYSGPVLTTPTPGSRTFEPYNPTYNYFGSGQAGPAPTSILGTAWSAVSNWPWSSRGLFGLLGSAAGLNQWGYYHDVYCNMRGYSIGASTYSAISWAVHDSFAYMTGGTSWASSFASSRIGPTLAPQPGSGYGYDDYYDYSYHGLSSGAYYGGALDSFFASSYSSSYSSYSFPYSYSMLGSYAFGSSMSYTYSGLPGTVFSSSSYGLGYGSSFSMSPFSYYGYGYDYGSYDSGYSYSYSDE